MELLFFGQAFLKCWLRPCFSFNFVFVTFIHVKSNILLDGILRPKKRNCLFPVLNGLKKSGVGRSEFIYIFDDFFGQKCVFYACFLMIWSREG